MATRKDYPNATINDHSPDAEQTTPAIPALTVRVYPARNLKNPASKFRGEATVNIGGCFAVKGFKIFDSSKGLFVKNPEQTYVKNGTELSREAFFPITAEARIALNEQILKSYEITMEHLTQQTPGDTLDEDDEVPELEDDDLPFDTMEDALPPPAEDENAEAMGMGM